MMNLYYSLEKKRLCFKRGDLLLWVPFFLFSEVILICNRFAMLLWSLVYLIPLWLFPDFCTVMYGEMWGDMLLSFLFFCFFLLFFPNHIICFICCFFLPWWLCSCIRIRLHLVCGFKIIRAFQMLKHPTQKGYIYVAFSFPFLMKLFTHKKEAA